MSEEADLKKIQQTIWKISAQTDQMQALCAEWMAGQPAEALQKYAEFIHSTLRHDQMLAKFAMIGFMLTMQGEYKRNFPQLDE